MWQEMRNADIWILAVSPDVGGDWLVWGNTRDEVDRYYQAAMTGRWPYKKPLYRVIARRKVA